MTIQSKEYTVSASAGDIFGKLSDLNNLKPLAESVQNDKFSLEPIDATRCRVCISGGLSVTFAVTETIPNERITLASEDKGLPVSGMLSINLKEATSSETALSAEIDADVPIFLRGMAKPMMQQAVEKLAEVLAKIPYNA